MKGAMWVGLLLGAMLGGCDPESVDTGGGDTAVEVQFRLGMAPQEAGKGASLEVVLSANRSTFRFGETQLSLGEGVTVESVTVLDVFETVARVHVDPDAELGLRDVLITVGDNEYVLEDAFRVIEESFAIDPSAAKMGEFLYVSLVGTRTEWEAGYSFASFGAGIDVLEFNVFSPGLAEARIAIRPDAAPGPRTVSVTDGPKVVNLYDGFTVDRAVITAFWDPPEVRQATTVPFTLTGLDTAWNANTVIEFWDDGGRNNDIQVVARTVVDGETITGQIAVSNAARLAYRDVVVTTDDESILIPDALQVLDTPPDLFDVVPQLRFDVLRSIDNNTGDILENVIAYAIFFIPLNPPCGAPSPQGDGPQPYDNNGVFPIPPPPEPVDCPNPETVSAGDFVWFEGPENVVTLHKDVIQSTGQILYWGQDLTLDDYRFGTVYDLHTQGDPNGIPEVLVEEVQPTVPADYYLLTPEFWGDLTVPRGEPFTYTWTPAMTYPDAIFGTQIGGTLVVDGEPGFAGSLPWDDGEHTYRPSELLQLEAGPVGFGAYSYIQGRYFGLPFSRYQTARSSSTLSTDAYMILQ